VDLWKSEALRLAKFCEANNITTISVYREIFKAMQHAERKKAERGQGRRQSANSSSDGPDSDDDSVIGGGGGTGSAAVSHDDALAGMGQRGRGLSAGAYDLDGLEKKDSNRRASAGPLGVGGASVPNAFRHRNVKLEDTWTTSHVPLAKDSLIGNPTGGPAAAGASSLQHSNSKTDSTVGKWAQAKHTVAGASAVRRGGTRGSGSEKVHPSSTSSKHGQPVLLMYDIED